MQQVGKLLQSQRAAVLIKPGTLQLRPRLIPRPVPGTALVRVTTVGICGSDVAYFRGRGKYPADRPFVLGHEASGVVVEVAGDDGPPWLVPGKHVALIPGSSCQKCARCKSGLDNLCARVTYLGSAGTEPPTDGALQEFICLPAHQLQPIPDNLPDAVAALLEPLAVAQHAVSRARVKLGNTLVIGGGAIGQLVHIAARAEGASSVILCEPIERRRDAALTHGTDAAFDPAELRSLVDRGARFDAVIDTSGNATALSLAIEATAPGTGRLVIVGTLPKNSNLRPDLIANAECWVTAIQRFPGGLSEALSLATKPGVDLEWMVERITEFDSVTSAFEAASSRNPPIKVQVRMPSYSN